MKPFWKSVFGGCLGTLLAFIIFNLILVGIISSLVSSSSKEEQPTVGKNTILKIDLSAGISEQSKENFNFSYNPLGGSTNANMSTSLSILKAIKAIEVAATDPNIPFIYLKADNINMDVAQAEELRSALASFRSSGKPVISYSQQLGNGTYYMASVADKVILNTYGDCLLNGMSSNIMYYKDLIDKLGIDIQLVRHGKYKSAGEPYITNTMSDANREQYEVMLGSIWNAWSKAMADSRDFTQEDLDNWINNLEIKNAEVAKEKGLVDELWFDDQVRDYFCTLCDVKKAKDLKYVSLYDYAAAKVKKNARAKDKIAVIYADGEIVMDDNGDGYIGNNFAKEIAKARQDSSIKAVVFRVNSPGGSVQASAEIEREVALLKECKPVIASYGGYAASGGYWISCGCDKIFSDNTTLTGSIGVFGLVPSFQRALKKNLYLNVYDVKTHKHGSMMTGMAPLDAEQLEWMQGMIEHTYEDFTGRVAAGRSMEVSAVDDIAQGRVWAGSDALKIGLVDDIGGLKEAIAYAASAVGLENYNLVEFPVEQTTYEKLIKSMSEKPGSDQDIKSLLLGLKNPEVVARMPFIEINK